MNQSQPGNMRLGWQNLGGYTCSSGTLVVRVTNQGTSGDLIADAVRIEWLSGGQQTETVNPAVGKYAMLDSLAGNTGRLDRDMTSTDGVTAYVVRQANVTASPAMAVMSIRTPLR